MAGFNIPTGGVYEINAITPVDITTIFSASPSFTTPNIILGVPASSLSYNGILLSGIAGENLVFGDVVYFKSDGKYWKAKADAYATTPVIGMAVGTISANATGNFLQIGIIRNNTWTWTIGSKLFLSASTAGTLTHTEPSIDGSQVQYIGYAISTTSINFNPNLITFEIATV